MAGGEETKQQPSGEDVPRIEYTPKSSFTTDMKVSVRLDLECEGRRGMHLCLYTEPLLLLKHPYDPYT